MVGGRDDMSLPCVTGSLPRLSAPKTMPYPPLVSGVPVNTGGNSDPDSTKAKNRLAFHFPRHHSLNLSQTTRFRSHHDEQLEAYQIGAIARDTRSVFLNVPKLDPMENNNRTLKELAMLNSELIHLLPKFHGLAGEDPHKHLKEFHVVCSTMRPQGIPEDYMKMKAFPFSLDGVAKDWLYLQLVMFNTWGDMKRLFLEKFFPTSSSTTIQEEIYGICQHFKETLHEY
ncbi:hypothetical protein CR513_12477, partial [Mucuna pruriens]